MNSLLKDLRIFPNEIELDGKKFLYAGIQKQYVPWKGKALAYPTYIKGGISKFLFCTYISEYITGSKLLSCILIDDEDWFWKFIATKGIK